MVVSLDRSSILTETPTELGIVGDVREVHLVPGYARDAGRGVAFESAGAGGEVVVAADGDFREVVFIDDCDLVHC